MNLREAAQAALNAMGRVGADLVCAGSHHEKKDRHGGDEPCPIQARWHKAYDALLVALAQPVPATPADMAIYQAIADNYTHPQPAPLTFSQITSEGDRLYQQDDKWHNANEWFERGVRFAERAHGIVPAPTTGEGA
jgi:hypothetical protein